MLVPHCIENQGLEKSRSISNPRKISGPADLDFFSGLALGFLVFFQKKNAALRLISTHLSNVVGTISTS